MRFAQPRRHSSPAKTRWLAPCGARRRMRVVKSPIQQRPGGRSRKSLCRRRGAALGGTPHATPGRTLHAQVRAASAFAHTPPVSRTTRRLLHFLAPLRTSRGLPSPALVLASVAAAKQQRRSRSSQRKQHGLPPGHLPGPLAYGRNERRTKARFPSVSSRRSPTKKQRRKTKIARQ